MAKKFGQFDQETSPTNDDIAIIKEATSGTTKRVTLQNWLPAGNVVTAKIADANVTTAKLASAAVTPVKWTNPYKFSAYRNAAYTPTSGSAIKMPYDAEAFDSNSNFDSTTNYRYTAPVSGFYQFNATTSWNTTTATRTFLSLMKNGSEVHKR